MHDYRNMERVEWKQTNEQFISQGIYEIRQQCVLATENSWAKTVSNCRVISCLSLHCNNTGVTIIYDSCSPTNLTQIKRQIWHR